ncbi:hypothetical protein CRUP_015569 [Coryphaenoides rupestris]|nr:hypothetical protein CRUP_015569 [Coryphaenoides rupestris]
MVVLLHSFYYDGLLSDPWAAASPPPHSVGTRGSSSACIQLLNKTWKEMRATSEDFNKPQPQQQPQPQPQQQQQQGDVTHMHDS